MTLSVFALFMAIASIAIFFLCWDYFSILYQLYPIPSIQNMRFQIKDAVTPWVSDDLMLTKS